MILICLPWDHGSSETDVFLDNFTQQDAMLRQMIDAISPHRDRPHQRPR